MLLLIRMWQVIENILDIKSVTYYIIYTQITVYFTSIAYSNHKIRVGDTVEHSFPVCSGVPGDSWDPFRYSEQFSVIVFLVLVLWGLCNRVFHVTVELYDICYHNRLKAGTRFENPAVLSHMLKRFGKM